MLTPRKRPKVPLFNNSLKIEADKLINLAKKALLTYIGQKINPFHLFYF
jgi:hypothetical protein